MSILVTGGAGYLGSHAVYQLTDRGLDVVVIDNLETGHYEAIHPKATFYEGDLRDIHFVKDVFKKESIEAVIHFAAYSLVGESMEEPLKYFDNNINATRILVQVMIEFDVSHIVFSSTAAVYGDVTSVPIIESQATKPTNAYGQSKLMVEQLLKWASIAHDIQYVSLRYFNVAGARRSGEIGESHQPETHLIPIVLETALDQRPCINIYGEDYDTPDGSCIRDYIHIEDLIDAHILSLAYLQEKGTSNIFNLGSGEGFSVKEIIEAARKVTTCDIPTKVSNRRAGDPSILIADHKRAKEILKWNPKRTSINTIIGDAWNWHKNNPEGYERSK